MNKILWYVSLIGMPLLRHTLLGYPFVIHSPHPVQILNQTCRCGFQYGDSIQLNSIADAER
jgi:hypothetical protein